jgi:hypothetical protein
VDWEVTPSECTLLIHSAPLAHAVVHTMHTRRGGYVNGDVNKRGSRTERPHGWLWAPDSDTHTRCVLDKISSAEGVFIRKLDRIYIDTMANPMHLYKWKHTYTHTHTVLHACVQCTHGGTRTFTPKIHNVDARQITCTAVRTPHHPLGEVHMHLCHHTPPFMCLPNSIMASGVKGNLS